MATCPTCGREFHCPSCGEIFSDRITVANLSIRRGDYDQPPEVTDDLAATLARDLENEGWDQ